MSVTKLVPKENAKASRDLAQSCGHERLFEQTANRIKKKTRVLETVIWQQSEFDINRQHINGTNIRNETWARSGILNRKQSRVQREITLDKQELWWKYIRHVIHLIV